MGIVAACWLTGVSRATHHRRLHPPQRKEGAAPRGRHPAAGMYRLRWSLLAMVAYAFLVAVRAREARHHRGPDRLVTLTCNEIARLLNALFGSGSELEHVLAWSVFRHAHQEQARICHYRRQVARES